MRCAICGRKLKDPKSIELGYGPICYKNKSGSAAKIRKKGSQPGNMNHTSYQLPGQMTLYDFLQI